MKKSEVKQYLTGGKIYRYNIDVTNQFKKDFVLCESQNLDVDLIREINCRYTPLGASSGFSRAEVIRLRLSIYNSLRLLRLFCFISGKNQVALPLIILLPKFHIWVQLLYPLRIEWLQGWSLDFMTAEAGASADRGVQYSRLQAAIYSL